MDLTGGLTSARITWGAGSLECTPATLDASGDLTPSLTAEQTPNVPAGAALLRLFFQDTAGNTYDFQQPLVVRDP